MNTHAAFLDDLLRHQTRRAQGIPTITTLVGPTGLSVRAWREWTTVNHFPYVIASEAESFPLLSRWVAAAFASTPPVDRVCMWLAALTGRPSTVMTREVGLMTKYDLQIFQRSLSADISGPIAKAAFQLLDDRLTDLQPDPARFVREIGDRQASAEAITRVIRAVSALYPQELYPAFLLLRPDGVEREWALVAARFLERITATEPRIPIAIGLSDSELTHLTVHYASSHAVALFREGIVELRGVSGNQLKQRLRDVGVEPLPSTVMRLTTDGLAEEVADAFVVAAQSVQNPTPAVMESDFRSVHEEFLFNQLESMPQTTGLFRPNCPLAFQHGQKVAEGDLVAESLKLVIEVDGSHYHLNADQYRRDRRKDWLYQRHGYLVLRFLAETVVSELEPVLDTILEAVALRRSSTQPTGAA